MTSAAVTVNGQLRELPAGATVAQLVHDVTGGRSAGVAVAVNGCVVRRADWLATQLRPGDRVEVLTAVQGG